MISKGSHPNGCFASHGTRLIQTALYVAQCLTVFASKSLLCFSLIQQTMARPFFSDLSGKPPSDVVDLHKRWPISGKGCSSRSGLIDTHSLILAAPPIQYHPKREKKRTIAGYPVSPVVHGARGIFHPTSHRHTANPLLTLICSDSTGYQGSARGGIALAQFGTEAKQLCPGTVPVSVKYSTSLRHNYILTKQAKNLKAYRQVEPCACSSSSEHAVDHSDVR